MVLATMHPLPGFLWADDSASHAHRPAREPAMGHGPSPGPSQAAPGQRDALCVTLKQPWTWRDGANRFSKGEAFWTHLHRMDESHLE